MTHLLGSGIALVAGLVMVIRFRGKHLHRAGLAVFVFGTVFMFAMSGVYHLLSRGGDAREVLQYLDHAAIWVMIAGTMTPIHLMLFQGVWRWGMLVFIWTLCITGIVLKSVFFVGMPEWLSLAFYLGMGWLGVVSFYGLSKRYGTQPIMLMIWGGLAYTIGAVIEFVGSPVVIPGVLGPHELFHIAVIAGVIAHWRFVRSFPRLIAERHQSQALSVGT